MIRLPPGRGRLWPLALDPSLFAILRKCKFLFAKPRKRPPLHVGIILIWNPIVVSFARQQMEQPATARAGKHATCQPRVESGRAKPPVASPESTSPAAKS